jgi:hypothetical protein
MKYICENDHIFEHTARHSYQAGMNHYEIPVCPLCFSRIYTEYVIDASIIISVISVPIDDVDIKLAEGYEVEALYAKTATLVKKRIKE